MVCRIGANENHIPGNGRRPDSLGILEELDPVDSAAVGVRYDEGLVLGKVGSRVAPPLCIRSNVGYRCQLKAFHAGYGVGSYRCTPRL